MENLFKNTKDQTAATQHSTALKGHLSGNKGNLRKATTFIPDTGLKLRLIM